MSDEIDSIVLSFDEPAWEKTPLAEGRAQEIDAALSAWAYRDMTVH